MNDIAWDGKPVKRACSECGSMEWNEKRTMIEGAHVYDWCSNCPTPLNGVEGIPDVYLGYVGQKFENLCDERGKPYEIRSKRHKKEIMDKLGVREAGDRVQGAKFGSSPSSWIEGTRAHRKAQFEKDRPMIRKIQRQYLDNVRRRAS